MKKILSLTFSIFLVMLFIQTSGQKLTVKSGSFEALKGVSTINVQYTYDNMSVGKFDNEQDYIDKKVADYNKDEAGKGDKWREAWVSDRKERYQPRFEEQMNEMFNSKDVPAKVAEDATAKYTLIFHTTFTEPGFNIGITRANAYIDGEVILVETANPGVVLAKMTVSKSPGRDAFGYDFDTGLRIQEAYAKAGKEIAYYIWKNFLK